jgi:hypothetical protein
VHLHQRLGERQAQARALLGLGVLALGLLEGPRQARQVLRVGKWALIAPMPPPCG